MKLKIKSESNSAYWIGGKHAVLSAINNNKRQIIKLIFNEKNKNIKINNTRDIEINFENDIFFKKIFRDEIPHQGYAALIEKIKEKDIQFYLDNNKISNIIALDGITDPRNVGSIVRSAVAFNYDAILINRKDVNTKSFLLYKAASGGMENIIFLEVSNIINEIRLLKSKNFWVVGMDGAARQSIYNYKLHLKNIIIFGSENKGIRNIVKENCDVTCRIPISTNINSLNVSSAAAASMAILKTSRL